MNKKVAHFIKIAREEAKAANIKVVLTNSKTALIGKIKVNGYFDDEDERILKCATGKSEKDWVPIFVHEYCHLRQYIDQCSAWKTYSKEESDVFFEWLEGQKFHWKTVKRFTRRTVALELDCEKRAVQVIKDFDLPLDIPEYIRKANAYLFVYAYALERRKWYKTAPYNIPEVYNQFRQDFKSNYNVLPDKYRKLFDKYCI